jgi:hypothetical protein
MGMQIMRKLFLMAAATAALLATAGAATSAAFPQPQCPQQCPGGGITGVQFQAGPWPFPPDVPFPPLVDSPSAQAAHFTGLVTSAPQLPGPKPLPPGFSGPGTPVPPPGQGGN